MKPKKYLTKERHNGYGAGSQPLAEMLRMICTVITGEMKYVLSVSTILGNTDLERYLKVDRIQGSFAGGGGGYRSPLPLVGDPSTSY